jgi:hypothetical protein
MLEDDYISPNSTTGAATVVPHYMERSISAPPLSGYAHFEVPSFVSNVLSTKSLFHRISSPPQPDYHRVREDQIQ